MLKDFLKASHYQYWNLVPSSEQGTPLPLPMFCIRLIELYYKILDCFCSCPLYTFIWKRKRHRCHIKTAVFFFCEEEENNTQQHSGTGDLKRSKHTALSKGTERLSRFCCVDVPLPVKRSPVRSTVSICILEPDRSPTPWMRLNDLNYLQVTLDESMQS